MLYALEAFIVLYLGYLSRAILKRSTAGNLYAAGILTAAIAASYVTFALSDWILGWPLKNPMLRVSFSVLLSLISYFGLSVFLHRRIRADDSARIKALESRLGLPRVADRTITGIMLVVLLALIGVFILFFVNLLAAVSPESRDNINERTLLLHALVLPEPPVVADMEDSTIALDDKPGNGVSDEEALALQGTFLKGFVSGMSDGKEFIAEKTGTKAFLEHVEALREIVNLNADENRWLIENTPELNALLNHPAITAVMDDENVLDLIEQVGTGSPTAIYKLGEEPAMIRLLNDPTVLKAVRAIDLRVLRDRVREQRRIELAARNESVTNRLPIHFGERRLQWPQVVRIGHVRAELALPTPVEIHISFTTLARVTVWANTRKLPVITGKEKSHVRFMASAGNLELEMVFDFSDTVESRECIVTIYSPGVGTSPPGDARPR